MLLSLKSHETYLEYSIQALVMKPFHKAMKNKSFLSTLSPFCRKSIYDRKQQVLVRAQFIPYMRHRA